MPKNILSLAFGAFYCIMRVMRRDNHLRWLFAALLAFAAFPVGAIETVCVMPDRAPVAFATCGMPCCKAGSMARMVSTETPDRVCCRPQVPSIGSQSPRSPSVGDLTCHYATHATVSVRQTLDRACVTQLSHAPIFIAIFSNGTHLTEDPIAPLTEIQGFDTGPPLSVAVRTHEGRAPPFPNES